MYIHVCQSRGTNWLRQKPFNGRGSRRLSVFVCSALHQLNLDMVGAFDKGRLTTRIGVGAVRDFDAVFLQPLECLVEAIHAEGDMVRHVAAAGLKISAGFPQLWPLRLGVFHGKDESSRCPS